MYPTKQAWKKHPTNKIPVSVNYYELGTAQISNLRAGTGICLAVKVSIQTLHTTSMALIPTLPTPSIHASHHLFKVIIRVTSSHTIPQQKSKGLGSIMKLPISYANITLKALLLLYNIKNKQSCFILCIKKQTSINILKSTQYTFHHPHCLYLLSTRRCCLTFNPPYDAKNMITEVTSANKHSTSLEKDYWTF